MVAAKSVEDLWRIRQWNKVSTRWSRRMRTCTIKYLTAVRMLGGSKSGHTGVTRSRGQPPNFLFNSGSSSPGHAALRSQKAKPCSNALNWRCRRWRVGGFCVIWVPPLVRSDHRVHNRGNGFTQLGTCLLYTSPSPRDATLSRMPSSA